MAETDELIKRMDSGFAAQSQLNVLKGLDADKDKAAHAVDLEGATGIDPQVIYGNYDEATRHVKSEAAQVLTQDPWLRQYINSHPLASSVSKDDWGNLSAFTDKLRDIGNKGIPYGPYGRSFWSVMADTIDVAMEGLKGLKEFPEKALKVTTPPDIPQLPEELRGKTFTPEIQKRLEERLQQTGVRTQLTEPLWDVLQIVGAPVIGGFRALVSRPLEQMAGVPKEVSEGFGLILGAALGVKAEHTMRLEKAAKEELQEKLTKLYDVLDDAAPFVKAGEDPPEGLNPAIDTLIDDVTKKEHKAWDDVEKAANATETKELSPELFHRLVSIGTKEDIGISRDGVRALYGDKVPEPGDGMLGDIPDIQKQMADPSGKDILVSKADWLAKVDKEVAKALRDDIRLRPQGKTLREVKEQEPPLAGPYAERDLVDKIRAASGLEPLVEKMKARPQQLELPGAVRQEDLPLFEPGALMDKARYERYQRLLKVQKDKDTQKQLADAQKEERKKQTPEWQASRAKVREEIEPDIRNLPSIRVSEFFQNGTFGGEDLGFKPRLDPKFLRAEDRGKVPQQYLSKGGLDPDVVAREFGYHSGQELINDMINMKEARGTSGPKEFIRRVIEAETDRMMQVRYGDLAENILAAAREHVISTTQMDLLREEYHALGMKLGRKISLTLQDIKDMAVETFNGLTASKVKLENFLADLGRSGRAAEAAFLKGDFEEAFRRKQEQVHLFAQAALVKKFQREQRQFENSAKRFYKREVEGVPPEHTNWIQTILLAVGKPLERSVQDLQENIALRQHKTLAEFADHWNTNTLPEGVGEYEVDYNPSMPIYESLRDGSWTAAKKTMDNATVGEFRAINNSIQGLIKHGRGQNEIAMGARKYNFETTRDRAIGELEKLGDKPSPTKSVWSQTKVFMNRMNAGLIQLESLFDRWSGGDPHGLFNQLFSYPFTRAGNHLDALRRQYAKLYRELKRYETDHSEKLPNDVFYDPTFLERNEDGEYEIPPGGTNFIPMTRGDLRGVLLNVGNKSNLEITARGYATTPQKILAWVHQHATYKDWKWAQNVGKIFGEIQRESDRMTMEMTNNVIEKLPLGKVTTNFGDLPGWYYPMVYDRTRGAGPTGKVEPPAFVRVMTDRGFERKRTGAAYPVDFNIDHVTDQIDRRLRDIAFRPVITEAGKLLLDKDFQRAVTRYQGKHYTDLFLPFLKDLAGQHGYTSPIIAAGRRFGEAARQNVIGTLIGWNPGTLLKHSTTSLVQSYREIGLTNLDFLRAMKDLYQTDSKTRKSNNKFLMEGGRVGNLEWNGVEELQRRMQNWDETLGGAHDLNMGERSPRERALAAGAWAIGKVDQWVSNITFLAKYRQAMRENMKTMGLEDAHLDAVDMGERAVRRTHGSTAITSRPEFMRQQGVLPKTLTSLYGFFNHIFNRFYRMSWMTKDMIGKAKRGEPVATDVRDLSTDFFFYIAAPVAVEEWIDSTCKPGDSATVCGAKWIGQGIAAPIPIVREVAHAIISGHDPSFGIFQSGYKAVSDMAKDLDPKRWDKYHFGNIIEHTATLSGVALGVGSKQIGRWGKFGYNYLMGIEKPRTAGDWWRALRYGTIKEPKR